MDRPNSPAYLTPSKFGNASRDHDLYAKAHIGQLRWGPELFGAGVRSAAARPVPREPVAARQLSSTRSCRFRIIAF